MYKEKTAMPLRACTCVSLVPSFEKVLMVLRMNAVASGRRLGGLLRRLRQRVGVFRGKVVSLFSLLLCWGVQRHVGVFRGKVVSLFSLLKRFTEKARLQRCTLARSLARTHRERGREGGRERVCVRE